MRRYGLIGYPLSHSFSRQYFTGKFEREKIADAVYENFSLKGIGELPDVLEKHPDLCGLNVTIPYKKEVLSFLTGASDAVQQMGACNCIKISKGTRYGYNTDTVGFEKSLLPFLKPYHQQALILGTGGASAAVEFVLRKLRIPHLFVSRTANAAAMGYDALDEAILSSHQLIINTTPLGMYPHVAESPDIPYQHLTSQHHLYDLIYNPAETKFLEKGRLQGASVQNGEEMLVLQAEESWRIWND
ncbi:MAG: shikimate dehydrogenase [Sediminibacterium sp.]